MHRLLLRCAAVLALAWTHTLASASGLQVSPVTLTLQPSQNADGLWLSNTGDTVVHAQVRVYHWAQENGTEKLTPSRDLLVSPPMVQLGMSERQLIRVIRSGAPAGPVEGSYRVIIDELPVEVKEKKGLQLVLRYSVPIFIAPTTQSPAPQLTWSLRREEGQAVLKVANSGGMHAQLADLEFVDTAGRRTPIWGSNGNASAPNPFVATMSIPPWTLFGGLGRVTGSTTMRGELIALQGAVPPGAYQDNFAGEHTSITLSTSTFGTPATCNTLLPGKFPFVVSATVAKSCLVTADPLNFGTVNGLPGQADRDQTSKINVTCTTPTPYTVALTPSNGSTTGAGTMTPTGGVPGNADAVPYRLYRNAARTAIWGSVTGTGGNVATGTGNGAAQALTLYGRVLGTSANVRPDSYRDVVTVSVTY
ncbi:spore coat protein U domain-containing protein [Variovorax sp. CCNWLW186]|uniref:spore coat protein U domain-containing protein n=1 Tax=Variovorax sp. CCNWLW186 TaxID=3127473 RepID=UPI0030770EC7